MERYWVFIDSKVLGPLEVPALRKVPGFTLLTQVCGENDGQWRVADEVVDIKSYFVSPPRVSAMPFEGNAAFKIELAPAPALIEELPPLESKPPMSVMPGMKMEKPTLLAKPTPAVVETPGKATPVPASGGALRLTCSVCQYKNPRDVSVCMKCGGALEIPSATPAPVAAANVDSEETTLHIERPPEVVAPKKDDSVPEDLPPATLQDSMALDIPVARIVGVLVGVAALASLALVGQRWWKGHHVPKMHKAVVAAPAPAAVVSEISADEPRVVHHRSTHHVHHYNAATEALPGVAAPDSSDQTPPEDSTPAAAAPSTGDGSTDSNASYHVLAEATPLKHRQSSPIDSPYAKKRRADRGLWSNQEDQAIQQVQQFRIYGGQRTVQRNTEILMQILRDREYNTGFETGRRPFFYNDLDWSATPKDGPTYEVHLTFSGGRELDGLARQPLRFAFDADLERGTVDPGGAEQVRSNTLHAFFDESRIPPDERRAIAKDTEELVLAAQPDSSPLALDTVVRHFVGTYGSDAVARVARAFGLNLVTKKMTHDPTLTADRTPIPPVDSSVPVPEQTNFKGFAPATETTSAAAPKKKSTSSKPSKVDTEKMGSIDYQMTRGEGKERRIEVHVPSKASIGQLWEALTSYDRYKQFVPDVLESEREGQDGSAIIVHTVSLTRFMFFVFKINLHLRIIEHPADHGLEFERIAGEFENFRGSVQINVDPTTRQPMMTFRATVVPQGKIPDWVFGDMTKRLIVPILDAIRARAEAG